MVVFRNPHQRPLLAGGLHPLEWVRCIVGAYLRHRVRSVAGLPAAVRSGLLRAVRPLVATAHRVRCVGIVPVGVVVRASAGVVSRLGERVLEVAQPLGSEIEGFHVRA